MPTLPDRPAAESEDETERSGSAALDALAYSPTLPAAIGAAVTLAAARALGADTPMLWSGIAGSGSFVVYAVDRLRDIARDRMTSPIRAAFFERHSTSIWIATLLCGAALLAALTRAPLEATLLYAAVGLAGLLHRRLKELAFLKTLYVSLAWTSVCVIAPWLSTARGDIALLAVTTLLCFAANLVASNLRDDEAHWPARQPVRMLALARAFAATSLLLGLLAPTPIRLISWIPLCELLALAFFRPTERYGHLAIDGALLLGATLTLIHQSALA